MVMEQVPERGPPGRKTCYIGTEALLVRRDHSPLMSPLTDGLVSDWDVTEQLWKHAFTHRLRIDPKEHPILLAESSFNTKPIRERFVPSSTTAITSNKPPPPPPPTHRYRYREQ
jgi:actin-related protein